MAKSGKTFEPLYFSELSFENLKCFSGRQTLSLLDQSGQPAMWNLLLGENGVGKTTILQSLVWMRPVEAAGEYDFLQPALMNEEKNSVLENLVRRDTHNMTINAKFVKKLRNKRVQSYRSYVRTGISAQTDSNGKLETSEPISNKKKREPDIQIIAYSANRHAGSLNLNEDEIADPFSSIFETETILYDPESILLDLDYGSYKKIGRAPAWNARLKSLVASILPEVRKTSNIIVKGPAITGKSGEDSGVHFRTPYGIVPFSALSLGYQTTLAWALDMAWRMIRKNPDSDDPLADPAIVLVDEIDLHLHPKWQRSIRQDLSTHFPATQFIVTAHSPIIAQASLDANLIILERDGDNVVINNDAEKYADWRIDQIAIEMFGLRSARPPKIQALFDERGALLRKRSRKKEEEVRLSEIEAQIQELPVWDTLEDRAAKDVINRAAALINAKLKNET